MARSCLHAESQMRNVRGVFRAIAAELPDFGRICRERAVNIGLRGGRRLALKLVKLAPNTVENTAGRQHGLTRPGKRRGGGVGLGEC